MDELEEIKRELGLAANAPKAEVKAAAAESGDPTIMQRFNKWSHEAVTSFNAEQKKNLAPMMAAQREASKKDKEALTSLGFNTGEGPTHSMVSGGDTFEKTPEEWSKQFPPEGGETEAAPEVTDLAGEVERRVGMQHIDGPKIQGTDALDAQIGSLFGNAQAYLASGKMPEGEDDEFALELKRLRGDYNDAKSSVEKRELLHTLVDAFTQFGAGYASVKTGADLTNIKTKQHDFGEDKKMLQTELQTDLGDLRSRRQEDITKRKEAADMGFKQTSLEMDKVKMARDTIHQQNQDETSAYNAKVDHAYKAAYLDVMAGKESKDAAKEAARDKDQYMRAYGAEAKSYYDKWGKAGNELAKISQGMGEYKGMSNDQKAQAASSALQAEVGMSPKEADTISGKTTGALWWSKMDTGAIRTAMDRHAGHNLKILQARKKGNILVVSPKGETGFVKFEERDAYAKQNYEILE